MLVVGTLVVVGFRAEKSNSQVIRGVSCVVVLLPIDSGIDLSITIDKLRVFIDMTFSILSAYQ